MYIMNSATICDSIIRSSVNEVIYVCNSDFSQVERDLFVSITAEMYIKLAKAFGHSIGFTKALQKADNEVPEDLRELSLPRTMFMYNLGNDFCSHLSKFNRIAQGKKRLTIQG